jgi:hypothetical protein
VPPTIKARFISPSLAPLEENYNRASVWRSPEHAESHHLTIQVDRSASKNAIKGLLNQVN